MKALVFVALVFLASASAFSQTQTCWLIVCDNGSVCDTLTFGYAPGATCGADSIIPCEWGERPPPPPAGVFDVRWVGRCVFGQGNKCDIRGYGPPTISDTFRVKFQPSDAGFPITLRWDSNCILTLCDSALLIDPFGGVIFRVRMDLQSQHNFNSPAFSDGMIILFGQHPPTHTEEESLVRSFSLLQNYPNPFNPSTNIKFQLPSSQFVSLRVFNVLGQKIQTLVNEKREPGEHTVAFDATGLPSGVYFYRLEAGSLLQQKKMLLLR